MFPNDIVVIDNDGAASIPAGMIDEVISAFIEQERMEASITSESGQARCCARFICKTTEIMRVMRRGNAEAFRAPVKIPLAALRGAARFS